MSLQAAFIEAYGPPTGAIVAWLILLYYHFKWLKRPGNGKHDAATAGKTQLLAGLFDKYHMIRSRRFNPKMAERIQDMGRRPDDEPDQSPSLDAVLEDRDGLSQDLQTVGDEAHQHACDVIRSEMETSGHMALDHGEILVTIQAGIRAERRRKYAAIAKWSAFLVLVVGFVPYLLWRVGIDQAVGSNAEAIKQALYFLWIGCASVFGILCFWWLGLMAAVIPDVLIPGAEE